MPDCLGRGQGMGLGGYQPGVYVPLKALFLVIIMLSFKQHSVFFLVEQYPLQFSTNYLHLL